jgi:hypothetical protein
MNVGYVYIAVDLPTVSILATNVVNLHSVQTSTNDLMGYQHTLRYLSIVCDWQIHEDG